MADDETAPILPPRQASTYTGERDFNTGYERLSKTRDHSFIDSNTVTEAKVRNFTVGFVAIVTAVVILTVILSIVQGARKGGAYLLLGINIICWIFFSTESFESLSDLLADVRREMSQIDRPTIIATNSQYILTLFEPPICKGIGCIELALVYAFKFRGVLTDKSWFLYLVGFIVFTEAIFTNVLLFNS